MAVLTMRHFPDPILKQKAKRVPTVDKSIQKLIDDMVETMQQVGGVGLAAPQVGVSRRVIVLQMPEEEPMAVINPEIVRRSGEREVSEACLSVPGYAGKIKRSASVTVKGLNRQGKPIRIKATNLMAQALQHELDHLNGTLYIDHIESQENLFKVEAMKTLVQCDFDGTLTEKDASFLLLDAFADGDWRHLLRQYRERKITVNHFNTHAFAMIKADEQTLLDFLKKRVKIRVGFPELIACCRKKGFQPVIVSNGLDFYIKAILNDLGQRNIQVFAAQTQFGPDGIETKYIGPEGNQLEDNFKEAYTRLFLKEGYRVIYLGNGFSDFPAAKEAHHVFATGELLAYCQKMNLDCTPFADLNDVVKGLELL